MLNQATTHSRDRCTALEKVMFNKISEILRRDSFQRVLYTIALIVITISFWEKLNYDSSGTSTYGISFFSLYSILFILLVLQITLNNKIIWFINLCLFIFHCLFSLMQLIIGFMGEIKIERNDIISLFIFIPLITLITWVVYNMKQQKNIE